MSSRGSVDRQLVGECGQLVRQFDWDTTPLGDISGWSDALNQTVGTILCAPVLMSLRWGPALVHIYNDAYRAILGDRHPAAFGQPLSEVWPEVFDEIGPVSLAILRGEQAGYFVEDHLWRLRRHGDRLADAWFTISCGPVPDVTAAGGIGGVLVTAIETTGQHRSQAALRSRNRSLSSEVSRRTHIVGRHITAQKEAQQALREGELHFRLLVDSVVDYAIYMLDPDGIVSSWNSGAQRIKGYREDEIIGRHFSQFYTPEDRAAGVPQCAMARAAAGTPYEAEGWRVRKDGSRFWASVTLSAIRGRTGTLIGFAKVTRDITEQRQSQENLRRAQERLAQSQKLEMLGQLTGAIAHDFNNLLMVIGANTQMIKRRLVDPPSLGALEAVEHAASRGETLTRRLLTFSRRQALNPIVIDVAERLAASREILATSAGKNVELTVELPEPAWPVLVDVPEFELALVNIVVNARDAMPDGGAVRIVGDNVRLTPDDAVDDLVGEFVALRISDTGPGIDPEVLSRVFEPFFTTKAPDRGTGLGLSQVYGFARQSNGTALVTSDPAAGRGTTVMIYLPRAIGSAVVAARPTAEDEPKGAAEHILVVEDNHEVQQVTAAYLEELGYRVSTADNADEALALLARGTDVSLMFSDIVMPGEMNGAALARRVRRVYPHVAVLLTTGYAPQPELIDGALSILRKPYRLATLSSALRETLDLARAATEIQTGRG